jgi:hypothetical protein
VTVLQPAPFTQSGNSTLCKAEVQLVNVLTNLPPSAGTAVPAVWQGMSDGKNDNYSTQLGEKMFGFANSTGYANFTSPRCNPFNSSGGHGCNTTVLAAEATNYTVHASSSLHNHALWDSVNCTGEWVESPCDALCESPGNITHTFRATYTHVYGGQCGGECPFEDGTNKTTTCVNSTFSNCTGLWPESKACDGPCESKGSRTMTYHITKPAMSRFVNGQLVPGADCEARDMQTRDEECFNKQNCTLALHADVYSKSGGAVHGDLAVAPHPRPDQ